MRMRAAALGVDKESDNKTAERENRKFSTWKRYVLLNNTKFFDICEGNKLERQWKAFGGGLTMSIPLGRYVISRGENIRDDVSRET